ncbi:MAG: hypothetical protein JW866_09995, partial [Ignavibacteriales bacterium]|nr:hypothetical protein [Ignavibacteriales bacterium]
MFYTFKPFVPSQRIKKLKKCRLLSAFVGLSRVSLLTAFGAQQQLAGHAEQAAGNLPVAQALAEDQKSHQCHAGRLEDQQQVDDAEGQVLK